MSNPKATKDKDARRKQFSAKEYNLLCDWLEIDGNLDNIFGSKGKIKVGGKYHTKKLAFDAMAQYINNRQYKGSNLATVDFQGAKNRFNHLNMKYKRVKQMSEASGFGVIESDEAHGIHSIATKLAKLCPCFDRLDRIFGNKPKVDTQSNLYLSPLLEEVDGTTPDDFLTQHDTTRDISIVDHHDLHDIVEVGDPEVSHMSPEVEGSKLEPVLEQRAATTTICVEKAQQQLVFLQQQLDLEGQRLRLEEKKLEQDAVAKEAELVEGKRARKVQARIILINANTHRPPHELAEIIAMIENVD